MSFYGSYTYTTVGEKIAKAQKYINQMKKKGIILNPIELDTKLNLTWWGRAWNTTIEECAVFSNRLSRGKSYIKNGFVLDIKINQGRVDALVAGSHAKPYNVTILVNPITEATKRDITHLCGERIDSIEDLIAGKIPIDLKDSFTRLLFPSANDFHMHCSCPDYACVCKHIAAVMYAISAMLDKEPLLFFTLRGLDYQSLIKKSVAQRTKQLLSNAKKKSNRELDKDSIERLFGIN